jgi:thiosulfate reductase cytochrome b subunit
MRVIVPRFEPQNQALGSNKLARVLAEPSQNGNLVRKKFHFGCNQRSSVHSHWEQVIEDGVQGIHFVLCIFVMTHLVFMLICATCGTHHSRRIQPLLERRISSPTKLTADVIATAIAT